MSEQDLIYEYHKMANKQAIDNYHASEKRKQRKAFWRDYVKQNIRPYVPSVNIKA